MNKGKKYLNPVLAVAFIVTLLIGQGSGYLSQKLMVENNIRDRVKDALSKIIDSHKYVINVDVELEILDEVNEQITVFAPREEKKVVSSPAEKTAEALVRIQEKMIQDSPSKNERYSIGLPIPGFEVDVTNSKPNSNPLAQVAPISPKTMQPIDQPMGQEKEREVVDKILSRKRPSRAEVKRMDLALILQEGAAPELIENIRQLTMAASKFDRDRGDKLTIMTASFKERRDQRSAEQIMLKNIAEKIELLEQKRVAESTDWRDDIAQYKEEVTLRREEDMAMLETQLEELDKKRLTEAAEYEKREMARRDSVRNSKLEQEIQALRDMLAVNVEDESVKKTQLDSSRFAMLDNELQTLRGMLLKGILQDSVEAQKKAQAQIELELAEREKEKASADSLLKEKLAALDAELADLDAMQGESEGGLDSSTLLLIGLGVLCLLLVVALIFVLGRNKQQVPPAPPWMYPPPRPLRRRKKPAAKKNKKSENKKEQTEEKTTKGDPVNEESVAEVSTTKPAVVADAGVETQEEKDTVSLNDDPNVLKSEIDDIRKSVVSMSVGQPGRTSTIVKEWLEQPAPEAPEAPEEPSEDEGDDEGDDD